eukprot:8118185-Pyramimonas_sp.AAC.1
MPGKEDLDDATSAPPLAPPKDGPSPKRRRGGDKGEPSAAPPPPVDESPPVPPVDLTDPEAGEWFYTQVNSTPSPKKEPLPLSAMSAPPASWFQVIQLLVVRSVSLAPCVCNCRAGVQRGRRGVPP